MSSPQPPSPDHKPLGFDELIAIILAFTAIGTIFFWSIGKRDSELIPTSWQSPPASESFTASQPNQATSALPLATKVSPTLPATKLSPQTVPSSPPLNIVSPPPITAAIPLLANLATVPAPAKTPAVQFSDVPQDYWARPFIEALADRQILAGFRDNKFEPSQPMTRAQLAAILPKIAEHSLSEKAVKFQDVKSDYWAATTIEKTVKMGFLKGYPGNAFRPNESVSRAQVLAALANGLNLKPSVPSAQTLAFYQDAKQVPNWAIDQVAAATEAGLVVNYPKPEILNPNAKATRADVAAMVYQALVKSGQAEAKPSEYIIRR